MGVPSPRSSKANNKQCECQADIKIREIRTQNLQLFMPECIRTTLSGHLMHPAVYAERYITAVIYIFLLLLIIGAFIYFASIPLLFEKTFTNEGVEVTFHSGNLTIKNGDKIITGTYEWDSKGNEYYIHCKDSENNKYEYRFKYNEDTGGSLCLLVGNECQTIYYPKIKIDETEAGKTSLQMTCIK